MHTPNDLQDAIRERADRAPTPRPELLMAPLGARHTHRRAGIVIAAAAVAVATVAIAPSLLRHDQGPAARR